MKKLFVLLVLGVFLIGGCNESGNGGAVSLGKVEFSGYAIVIDKYDFEVIQDGVPMLFTEWTLEHYPVLEPGMTFVITYPFGTFGYTVDDTVMVKFIFDMYNFGIYKLSEASIQMG